MGRKRRSNPVPKMATDVNKETRKRKSTSDLIFEVDDEDISPSQTPEPPKQIAESLVCETEVQETKIEVNTVETVCLNIDEKMTQSIDEVNNTTEVIPEVLQTENEKKDDDECRIIENNSTETDCADPLAKGDCIPASNIKTDADLRYVDMEVENSPQTPEEKPFISVIFRDHSASHLTPKLIQYIKNVANFEMKLKLTSSTNNLTIDFWEDIPKVKSPSPEMNLFVVDTTPSNKRGHVPMYIPTFRCKTVGEKEPEPELPDNNCRSAQTCFNCDGNHSIKDCKEVRNSRKIALARNKFKAQQQKSIRYHVDEEAKYKHIQPGKISDELRRALDVRRFELPPYIYRMRALGYPPGWLQEAMISDHKLELFDFQGCVVDESQKDNRKIDASKVIEYPGFNAPLEKGYKDEFKYYNCPPYTEKFSKDCMVAYIEQLAEQITVKKIIPAESPRIETIRNIRQETQTVECTPLSPSLIDLELRKKQLLAELEDGEISSPQPATDSEKDDSQINPISKDLLESPSVVSSSFGTPIIKSASPYFQLPVPQNFSKDICPVINFENLPDSTGKYEQMSAVISKVRETVKNKNNKS